MIIMIMIMIMIMINEFLNHTSFPRLETKI